MRNLIADDFIHAPKLVASVLNWLEESNERVKVTKQKDSLIHYYFEMMRHPHSDYKVTYSKLSIQIDCDTNNNILHFSSNQPVIYFWNKPPDFLNYKEDYYYNAKGELLNIIVDLSVGNKDQNFRTDVYKITYFLPSVYPNISEKFNKNDRQLLY